MRKFRNVHTVNVGNVTMDRIEHGTMPFSIEEEDIIFNPRDVIVFSSEDGRTTQCEVAPEICGRVHKKDGAFLNLSTCEYSFYTTTCESCGKEFYAIKGGGPQRKFCSDECREFAHYCKYILPHIQNENVKEEMLNAVRRDSESNVIADKS